MSDTPETDAALYPMNEVDIVWPDFARKLERERDEARDHLADALQEVDLRTLDFERIKEQHDEAQREAVRYRSLYYTRIGIDRSASWFPWEAKNE